MTTGLDYSNNQRFKIAGSFFDLQVVKYLRTVGRLLPEFEGRRYSFIDNTVYERILRENPVDAMRIYWSEILMRAHLAATTSILRGFRWVDGVIEAVVNENLLVFAASMRGIIESAADSSVALGSVPETLARDHSKIEKALSGELKNELWVNPGLEESLIHYSHASKVPKGANVPSYHHAKMPGEYLKILERGDVPRVFELYSFLCDLTHPGMSSVAYWFEQEAENQLTLHTDRDSALIKNVLFEYKESFLPVLMFSFNPGIVTFAVLNYFSLPPIHTRDLRHWNLNSITLWTKAKRYLVSDAPELE